MLCCCLATFSPLPPLHPQGEQQESRKRSLHPADRIMYAFGQLVFSSTRARLATFAYLAVLHLLVFSSLMHMTGHSSHALYSHHAAVLEHGRHNAMDALHGTLHGEATPAAAVSADPRLP
jgi:hypothetical protein